MDEKHVIEVNKLEVAFPSKQGMHSVVDQISFSIEPGEIFGIVGESGSGKSMTALAIMGLFSKEAIIKGGTIRFLGRDLLTMKDKDLRKIQGDELAMIFQEPMTCLNPIQTVGAQVEEMLRLHEAFDKNLLRTKTLDMFQEVGLKPAEHIYEQYPHQLSGGMRQRVMIAMAMICNPKLLIADEPTTALDVTVQAQILKLIHDLNRKHGTSIILISHDLGVIQAICSRALVMKAGKIVESASVRELFHQPKEAYTEQLLAAVPRIQLQGGKKGNKKGIENEIEHDKREDILSVENLNTFYQEKRSNPFVKKRKQVLNQVSLHIKTGEILGVVGESGCGKSTLAKAIVQLIEDMDGNIVLKDVKPQMVFQDPYGSLNPAKTIGWIIEEPLKIKGGLTWRERKRRVVDILGQVGLAETYLTRHISQLSGGQRQRVAIAAALVTHPRLIILDEPVSSLDVTVQAQILDLLLQLKQKYELSYLFISHDLNVIHQMSDRVCVMHQGEIVESAEKETLFQNPTHPYTKELIAALLPMV